MEKIIGLMGAMREEIALLCERMTDKGEETVAGVTFYTGLLQGRRVALCCAGIGKVNAACAAQLLIARFGAKVLVFSGIAGNMTDKIGVGDVVIGGTLVYHDADREMISDTFPYLKEFAADPVLVAAAEQACTGCGRKIYCRQDRHRRHLCGRQRHKNALRLIVRRTVWRWRARPWPTWRQNTVFPAWCCAP